MSRHRKGARHTPAAEQPATAVPSALLPTQLPGALPTPPQPPAAPPGLPPVPQPPAAPPVASGLTRSTPPGSTLALDPPSVVTRPIPSLLPTGRGQRKQIAREERRRKGRRVSLIAGASSAAVLLVAGVVIVESHGGKPTHTVGPAVTGRTQRTVLLSVAPAGGAAIESVLLADDHPQQSGAVVMVPTNVVTQIAGHGTAMLADATQYGGDVPAQTFSDLVGITVDGSVTVTPAGLTALIDKLGGITADVPSTVTVNGQTVVAPGDHQLLTGGQAVAFATYLAPGESSVARLARFESVLNAVLAKIGTSPAAVGATLAGLSGTTFGSDRPVVGQVVAGVAGELAQQNLTYATLPTDALDTGDSTERLSVDNEQLQALVKRSFATSVPKAVAGGHNRVVIYNGTGGLGLGESARDRLTAHGLVFVSSANQPGFPYANKPSVVLIPDVTPVSVSAGQRVAAALGLPASDIETSPQAASTVADVTVILGDDYKP